MDGLEHRSVLNTGAAIRRYRLWDDLNKTRIEAGKRRTMRSIRWFVWILTLLALSQPVGAQDGSAHGEHESPADNIGLGRWLVPHSDSWQPPGTAAPAPRPAMPAALQTAASALRTMADEMHVEIWPAANLHYGAEIVRVGNGGLIPRITSNSSWLAFNGSFQIPKTRWKVNASAQMQFDATNPEPSVPFAIRPRDWYLRVQHPLVGSITVGDLLLENTLAEFTVKANFASTTSGIGRRLNTFSTVDGIYLPTVQRQPRALAWASPRWFGFQLTLMYVLGHTITVGGRQLSHVALTWLQGPWYVGLGYDDSHNPQWISHDRVFRGIVRYSGTKWSWFLTVDHASMVMDSDGLGSPLPNFTGPAQRMDRLSFSGGVNYAVRSDIEVSASWQITSNVGCVGPTVNVAACSQESLGGTGAHQPTLAGLWKVVEVKKDDRVLASFALRLQLTYLDNFRRGRYGFDVGDPEFLAPMRTRGEDRYGIALLGQARF
jgi:hypothetical protein